MKPMRRTLLLLAATILPAAAAAQQPVRRPSIPAPTEPNDVRPWGVTGPKLAVRSPRFEDFAAGAVYKGRPAAVDLASAAGARTHRTVLRRAAARGASFGGHYAVATWGCGAGCQRFALVDVRTGKVWISPAHLVHGAQYRADSNLFVLNPPVAGRHDECGSSPADPCPTYLMMGRGGRLVPLDSEDAHG
jgi:hypothetical protein